MAVMTVRALVAVTAEKMAGQTDEKKADLVVDLMVEQMVVVKVGAMAVWWASCNNTTRYEYDHVMI